MSKIKKNILELLNRDWDFYYLVPGVSYNVIKSYAIKSLHIETNNLFYPDLSVCKEWNVEPLSILLYKLITYKSDFEILFSISLNILHYIEKNEKFKDLNGLFYSITVNALFAHVLIHFGSTDRTFQDLLEEDLKNLKWTLASGFVL